MNLKVHLVADVELLRFYLVFVHFRVTFLCPHPFLYGDESCLRWELALRLKFTQPPQIWPFGKSFADHVSPFKWGFSHRVWLSNQIIIIIFVYLCYGRIFLKWSE